MPLHASSKGWKNLRTFAIPHRVFTIFTTEAISCYLIILLTLRRNVSASFIVLGRNLPFGTFNFFTKACCSLIPANAFIAESSSFIEISTLGRYRVAFKLIKKCIWWAFNCNSCACTIRCQLIHIIDAIYTFSICWIKICASGRDIEALSIDFILPTSTVYFLIDTSSIIK